MSEIISLNKLCTPLSCICVIVLLYIKLNIANSRTLYMHRVPLARNRPHAVKCSLIYMYFAATVNVPVHVVR